MQTLPKAACQKFFNSFSSHCFPETMAEAYVLINCDLGTEEAVIKELKSIAGVSEVKGVFGVYDVIARISSDSESGIKKVIGRVRAMNSVKSSLTMMVVEGQGD